MAHPHTLHDSPLYPPCLTPSPPPSLHSLTPCLHPWEKVCACRRQAKAGEEAKQQVHLQLSLLPPADVRWALLAAIRHLSRQRLQEVQVGGRAESRSRCKSRCPGGWGGGGGGGRLLDPKF